MDSEEKALSLYSDFREKLVRKRTSPPKALQKCYNSGFPIEAACISIRSQQQSLCPVWRSRHLLTDLLQLCIFRAFDDHFIVNMTDNEVL